MNRKTQVYFGDDQSTSPKILIVREYQFKDSLSNEVAFDDSKPWMFVIDSDEGILSFNEGYIIFSSLKMANFIAAHIEAYGLIRSKAFDIFDCLFEVRYLDENWISGFIFDFLVLDPLLQDFNLNSADAWWKKEIKNIKRKHLLGPGREQFHYNPFLDWRAKEISFYERHSGFCWDEFRDDLIKILDSYEEDNALEAFRSNNNFLKLLELVETECAILRYWQKAILSFILTEFNTIRKFGCKEVKLDNLDANRSLWPPILLSLQFVKGQISVAEYVRRLLHLQDLIPTESVIVNNSEDLSDWGINPELYQKLYNELLNYLAPISELIHLEKEEDFREITYFNEADINTINLPSESYLALNSATRNLMADEGLSNFSDYSQVALLAGKAVEVFLIETIFRNFKIGLKKASIVELSEDSLNTKAKSLYLFISKSPGFITLGEMAFILKLKGGKTEKNVRILFDFFKFISESGFSNVFKPKMLQLLDDIVNARNRAAHKDVFNRNEAEAALENAIFYIESSVVH